MRLIGVGSMGTGTCGGCLHVVYVLYWGIGFMPVGEVLNIKGSSPRLM